MGKRIYYVKIDPMKQKNSLSLKTYHLEKLSKHRFLSSSLENIIAQ